MELDQVVTDHSKENLETIFSGAKLVAELPFFSIMAKETSIPWLLFIPKTSLENMSVMLMMYGQVHKLANTFMEQGMQHYNFAKIGNKNPWLHYHLVFRREGDEAWPDPVWCHEPLTANPNAAVALSKRVKLMLQDSSSTSL